MKKTGLSQPPEGWSSHGQALYRAFEAMLFRELKYPRKYLVLLRRFFSDPLRQNLSFREYPPEALDAYLATLSRHQRDFSLCALARWLRFLQGLGEPLDPERPVLPGGPVGQKVRRNPRLQPLMAPSGWSSQAQKLYEEFRAQLEQRLRYPRAVLLPLRFFLLAQQEQGLSFRDFPRAWLESYCDRSNLDQLRAVRSWVGFLYKRKELLLPLHQDLAGPRTSARNRRSLTHEEMQKVLSLPPLDGPEGMRDRAMLEVAYATGMRQGEMVALDLCDLDLAAARMTIRKPKNGIQRTVPLTHWACRFLTLYLEKARPQLASPLSMNALWLNPAGQRAHRSLLGRRLLQVYRARERLDFVFTIHQIRHTCATELLKGGASVRDVQELLGHEDLNSTERYTHLTPLRLVQIHERHHPRNNGSFDLPGQS